MTFAALLTWFSILVAVLALARPVGRRSLELFVPRWRWFAAILLSVACMICRDAPLGVPPLFHLSLDLAQFLLTLIAFLVPLGVALWSWATWSRAKITSRNIGRVESVFSAALREKQFDEVERIVRKNQERLATLPLPTSAASALFNPAMVVALMESSSLVHLELLANMGFLKSLENRLGAVDVVVRALLRASASPLQSAVVKRYGGLEHLEYAESERELMEKTFQNPDWYLEACAHYPLVISAVEELRRAAHDSAYNDSGRDYESSQGISTRAHCPIYLAAKTVGLAVEAALERRAEGDFYVSDLFDIFRAVQERSKFDVAVWESDRNNHEFPTPYAYLLYGIAADLHDLSCKAVQEATSKTAPRLAEAPGRIAQDLAQCWSYCVWWIADSQDQVSQSFRDHVIKQYLLFMLALGWEPSEVYFGHVGSEGLQAWRDLFMSELRHRFAVDRRERIDALRSAIGSLDQGKRYVSEGYSWLKETLFP